MGVKVDVGMAVGVLVWVGKGVGVWVMVGVDVWVGTAVSVTVRVATAVAASSAISCSTVGVQAAMMAARKSSNTAKFGNRRILFIKYLPNYK